jgi:hypothetical protein
VSRSLDDCAEKDGTFYVTKIEKDGTFYVTKMELGIFFRLFCPTNPAQVSAENSFPLEKRNQFPLRKNAQIYGKKNSGAVLCRKLYFQREL